MNLTLSRLKSLAPGFVYKVISLLLLAIEFGYFFPDSSDIKHTLGYCWIVVAVGFLIIVVVKSFSFLLDPVFRSQKHRYLFIITLIFPALLLLFGINGVTFTHVDSESTSQQSDALWLFEHKTGVGVYNSAFLGGYYPDRQYILAAIPSYVFGRGIVQYRIGYATIFMACYLSFMVGLARYLHEKKVEQCLLLAAFAGSLVAMADFTVCAYRLYEQICLPTSMMMLLLAGFLTCLYEQTYFSRFWVLWTIGFLPYVYTPALAGFGLAMLTIVYLQLRTIVGGKGFSIYYTVQLLLYGGITVAMAHVILTSGPALDRVKVGGFDNLTSLDWIWRGYKGFRGLLGQEQCVIPIPLTLSIIAMLAVTLPKRDFRFPAICCWAFLAAGAAIALKGWCWRSPETDVGRSMMILPILSTGVVLTFIHHCRQYLEGESAKVVQASLYAVVCYMILSSSLIPMAERDMRFVRGADINDTDEAFQDLDNLRSWSFYHGIKRLYIVPPLNFEAENITPYLFGAKNDPPELVRDMPPPNEKSPDTYVIFYPKVDIAYRAYDDEFISQRRNPHLELVPEAMFDPSTIVTKPPSE